MSEIELFVERLAFECVADAHPKKTYLKADIEETLRRLLLPLIEAGQAMRDAFEIEVPKGNPELEAWDKALQGDFKYGSPS